MVMEQFQFFVAYVNQMLSSLRNPISSNLILQLSSLSTNMDAHSLHEFKRKTSFFFKEKIKAARLALTDVTPAQLLTEEVTDGDSSVPDTRSMRLISRAAFEVDDYWRIVDILHKRLREYDRKNWRASYKALILLEYLLTHGPARVAEEFECDQEIIREMKNFQYVDEKGFNWGLTLQRKSERVTKLIEDTSFRKEERAKARTLTSGIEGFGSFCNRLIPTERSFKESVTSEKYVRCNSYFSDYQSWDGTVLVSKEGCIEKIKNKNHSLENISAEKLALGNEYAIEEDHPFLDKENRALASRLPSEKPQLIDKEDIFYGRAIEEDHPFLDKENRARVSLLPS